MCEKKVFFSIIIPVKNNADTLKRSLESIEEQLCNWEVLMVYDESNDNSLDILNTYSYKDSRFRIVHGRNKNLSAARNDGMKKARGEYILFLDADDAFLPNAFMILQEYIEKNKSDIYIFGTKVKTKKTLVPLGMMIDLAIRNCRYKKYVPKALFGETGARPFVWRNAYRREFIVSHSIMFDEDMVVGEDQVFQLEAFPYADNGIYFLNKKIYEYSLFRDGSLTNLYNKDLIFKLNQHIKMVYAVSEYWKSVGDSHYSHFDKLVAWAIFFLSEEIPFLDYSVEKEKLCKQAKKCLQAMIDSSNISISNMCYRRLNYFDDAKKKPRGHFFIDKLYWHWKYGGILPACLVIITKYIQAKRKYMCVIAKKI